MTKISEQLKDKQWSTKQYTKLSNKNSTENSGAPEGLTVPIPLGAPRRVTDEDKFEG
jgi:hypothetical protein